MNQSFLNPICTLSVAAKPEVMARRRESVEHPFGPIKQWMGQGAFLTRRLGNVRGEGYVRWILKQIYRKPGLSGQVPLVRLVLAAAPPNR